MQVMSLSPSVSYKAAEPTIHSRIIRHDSLSKAIWDWIVLLLVIYTAIEVPYNVAFIVPLHKKVSLKDNIWEILNLCVDILFIVDVIINFRTTYVEGRTVKVVSNPRKIACNYLRTWFFVDFVSAMPFELISLLSSQKGFVNLISLLKTARLLRLVRVARKLDRYSEYGIAVIFLLMGLFALSAHWFACIYYVIGRNEREHHANWINVLSRGLSGTSCNTHHNITRLTLNVSMTQSYLSAMYFTVSSLTSVGFGNVAANTNAEKAFAICVMLVGALMFATIFGNLTAIIQRLYLTTSKYHKDLSTVREFIHFYEIPSPLSDKLEDYTKNIWAQTKGVSVKKVLEIFPESLQTDICFHLCQGLFTTVSAFQEADESCLRALSMKFHSLHCLPKQYVVKQGDPIQEIYFICSGNVQIVRDGRTMLTLTSGDVISCDYRSPNHIPKANADLSVIGIAEIQSINYEDLLECLRAHPAFGDVFFQRLEGSYSLEEEEECCEEKTKFPHSFINARKELSYFKLSPSSHKQKTSANGSTCIQIQETSFTTNCAGPSHNKKEKEEAASNNLLNKKINMEQKLTQQRLDVIESKLNEMEDSIRKNFNLVIDMIKKDKREKTNEID
ncbi:potassium voltage-gated channel subfamily H member 6-like isoform X1 [Xenia sp. Carnegie-2017]|uniref:potassium voltage-gated channel subfamily H member 6-like isoform X1 n=1 Tax=Xenia sp. Carnegie-2017 TaxID=2897299 RepID=UPI001F035EAF|nr:potassium voltage-gated channel subfamily H member 6-like isoform X1 [Xenia sp. Carnegie-2017]